MAIDTTDSRQKQKRGWRKPRANARRGETERIAVRRLKALELRTTGMTYRQIATRLRVCAQTAHEDVQAALAEVSEADRGTAKALRALELERLDAVWNALWSKREDPKRALVLCRLTERRSRLLGLDVETEEKIQSQRQTTVTSEEAIALFAALTNAVRFHVADPHILHAIGETFERIIRRHPALAVHLKLNQDARVAS